MGLFDVDIMIEAPWDARGYNFVIKRLNLSTDYLFLLYDFVDSMTFNYSEGLQVSASYYGVFFIQVLVLIVNYALITPFILPP